MAVVTGILFTSLITLSGLFCWHLKRHRTKSESADHEMVNTDTRPTVQERNISDAVYEISDPNQTNNIPRLGDISPQRNYVNSSASPRRTPEQQSPRGSTRNGSYVNSGRDGQDHDLDSSSNRDYVNSQDNQPNEYEHLDPSMTSQNVYEKLNENTNI
ncbi:uncharacterized protein LOC121372406 [Gigantopelta aegis]|uniref:uncharacterized protein LOC121372406 n=1 Tax=Gigantopelta aegis TaxID=1735272 RepID=UPI001B88BB7D|nr:uncharacterized protein LOC121372406 [Gigantopelta aegis]